MELLSWNLYKDCTQEKMIKNVGLVVKFESGSRSQRDHTVDMILKLYTAENICLLNLLHSLVTCIVITGHHWMLYKTMCVSSQWVTINFVRYDFTNRSLIFFVCRQNIAPEKGALWQNTGKIINLIKNYLS